MASIRKFFRNLFGLDSSSDVICRKIGNEYYAYRNNVQISGPFTSCENCKAGSGASTCSDR